MTCPFDVYQIGLPVWHKSTWAVNLGYHFDMCQTRGFQLDIRQLGRHFDTCYLYHHFDTCHFDMCQLGLTLWHVSNRSVLQMSIWSVALIRATCAITVDTSQLGHVSNRASSLTFVNLSCHFDSYNLCHHFDMYQFGASIWHVPTLAVTLKYVNLDSFSFWKSVFILFYLPITPPSLVMLYLR